MSTQKEFHVVCKKVAGRRLCTMRHLNGVCVFKHLLEAPCGERRCYAWESENSISSGLIALSMGFNFPHRQTYWITGRFRDAPLEHPDYGKRRMYRLF
ncbi:hypothetical protein AVEN_192907-1 [Araneus ventricosus]|uniref:Uncharacterized protein n=1 Tax=Araneus ventricosus TaxID=182803 RepID=A0A4Y2JMN4_ARAVE|nr:hypothetical protein AVEN_192907-1 [Araneus ventricosus]